MFIELQQGSSGAAIAMAFINEASGEPCRREWAITGSLTLAGEVTEVGSVREKVRVWSLVSQLPADVDNAADHWGAVLGKQAVAAFQDGCKGFILPLASLPQLLDDTWPVTPEEPVVAQEVRDLWPQARAQLLFKPVSSVVELVAFYFPGLAAKARSGTAAGGRQRGRKRQVLKEDVGRLSRTAVPIWGGSGGTVLVMVEACLVKGTSSLKPVRDEYTYTSESSKPSRKREETDMDIYRNTNLKM